MIIAKNKYEKARKALFAYSVLSSYPMSSVTAL
jgi:hypothetical protein